MKEEWLMKIERALLYVVLAGSIVAPAPLPASQTPPDPPQRHSDTTEAPGADGAEAESPKGTAPTRGFEDPFEAYEAGAWEEALEGFLDRRTERPEDPAELLNVASTRYQMGDFDEAARTFASVAATAPPELRQKALYSLGNTAYRQGRLEEAVEHYRKALELDPDNISILGNAAVLAIALGHGRASRLYREVRDAGHATAISTYSYTPGDLGIFGISIELEPDDTDAALRATARALHEVGEHGFSDGEVERGALHAVGHLGQGLARRRHVEADHVRAVAREHLGDRLADPARGAGHQGRVAVEDRRRDPLLQSLFWSLAGHLRLAWSLRRHAMRCYCLISTRRCPKA